jgi:hypothetical protein
MQAIALNNNKQITYSEKRAVLVMKKRKFLVPIAISVAALIGTSEASPTMSEPAIPNVDVASDEQKILSENILGEGFIIQRSNANELETAYHRSHRSHSSHSSHRSHYSSYR